MITAIDCLIPSLSHRYQNGLSPGNGLQEINRFSSLTITSGLGEGSGLYRTA